MNTLKVLFHVNESARWQTVLVNISNFLKDVGRDSTDIEVLANGEAVSIFGNGCLLAGEGDDGQKASCGIGNGSFSDQTQKLSEAGVNFVVCRNSLESYSIDEDSLPAFVTVVPAGITEIVRKQAQGYAYIKP